MLVFLFQTLAKQCDPLSRSSTLKTHLRTHSNVKEFTCSICGKGFHQKGNLRNHVLIHTGEKPYECSVCKKSFNKLSNLKFHMHSHTDQKPYRCRYCKQSFSKRAELKHHIAICKRENSINWTLRLMMRIGKTFSSPLHENMFRPIKQGSHEWFKEKLLLINITHYWHHPHMERESIPYNIAAPQDYFIGTFLLSWDSTSCLIFAGALALDICFTFIKLLRHQKNYSCCSIWSYS